MAGGEVSAIDAPDSSREGAAEATAPPASMDLPRSSLGSGEGTPTHTEEIDSTPIGDQSSASVRLTGVECMPSNSSSVGAVGADFGRAAGGGRLAESNCAHETLEQTPPLPPDEVRRQSAGIRLLSLCGGPTRVDGVDVFVRQWGAKSTRTIWISRILTALSMKLWQSIRAKLEDGFIMAVQVRRRADLLQQPRLWPWVSTKAVRKGTVVALGWLESFRVVHGLCNHHSLCSRNVVRRSVFVNLTEVLAVIEFEGILLFALVQCEPQH